MLIQKEMKLAEVIHHDHSLIPVLNRFDIFLGFGEQTIEELCKKKQINVEFFLTMLNAYHDHQYFPKKHLQSFPASQLVGYLSKSHRYYIDEKIPEIDSLIQSLDVHHKLEHGTFLLLINFFNEYKTELINHIRREEERVYPYIIHLEKAILSGDITNELLQQMSKYSINDYEKEHDDVESKLYDLKNLIIKYLPVSNDDKPYFRILQELFALESDLNDHSRIEDLILVPKVEAMEYTIQTMKN